MKSRRQRALAIALLSLGHAAAATETSRLGVVIEEIGQGSALEKAGLRPGDLLFAWERSPDPPANPDGGKGEIRTIFDWLWVTTEQAPRGTVRLHGERNGVAISCEVPRGVWDARVRPRMAADLFQMYTEGRRRIDAGDLEGGIALWDQLVRRVEVPDLRCWLLLQVGEALSKGGRGEKASSALQAALSEARDARIQVAVGEALGKSHQNANELARAEASFRSALEAGETAWGESLQVASTLGSLGDVLRLQNRLDEAEEFLVRALEIRQRWSPDGLEVADSLVLLAGVAFARGDPDGIHQHSQRALTIQERWLPDGPEVARTLNTLALAAMGRGRFEEAGAALQRALTIQERQAPGSLPLARTLSNLGAVARWRGDEESAVKLLQRALAICERVAPESVLIPRILNNLGAIAQERGDLTAAAELFQRAMAIWGKAAPEGIGVAGGYDSLGVVARMRGDLDAAWSLHRRAFEIFERLAPGRIQAASNLMNLGRVAEARGDLSLALDFYQRSQSIRERLEPGTINEALTLQQLGGIYHRTRRLDQAAQLLARAIDALEFQVGRLGGSLDVQATYRARHAEIYRDAIEVELERGRAAEAFHLVERFRARSFLALLAERDLAFPGELPETLERSRRDNAARYDQILRELAQWTPAEGEKARDSLHGELSRLRREREELAAEIRMASPQLAALRQPQPLGLAAARQVLDPGTLALSYSVGKEMTALFAVTREGGLRVEILPVGEERLQGDVERLLNAVRQPLHLPASAADTARSLYGTLIAPVADLVERSERVLILPDGPLHRLPFGALIRDAPGHRQYLAEWKPLHTTLSLTVYGTLRMPAAGAAGGSRRLVAFGDPRYPQGLVPRREVHDPVRLTSRWDLRSFNWTALPHTRREVERIAEVYSEARLYLGEEATEERAKSVSRDARVLHFATHGYLDDRTPLDSALVLTIPEGLPANRDNGLLQVWEIFERVRIDADLVVLSACESALGRELGGEGMIGLTRAFQYAGAPSIVASLWSVADQTTAELMTRFHRHRAAGLSTDEALRMAQIELIRQPIRITTANGQALETDASAPFFWAAFQLFGDWR